MGFHGPARLSLHPQNYIVPIVKTGVTLTCISVPVETTAWDMRARSYMKSLTVLTSNQSYCLDKSAWNYVEGSVSGSVSSFASVLESRDAVRERAFEQLAWW